MRRFLLVAMLFVLGIGLVSCQEDPTSNPTSPEEPVAEIGDNVIVLDDPDNTDLEVMGNIHRYTKESGLPTDVEVGDILVDYIDGGHLRRVTGVTTTGDSLLEVATEQATLADYLHTAHIDTVMHLGLDSAMPYKGPHASISSAMRVAYMAPGVSIENQTLTLDEVSISDTLGNDILQIILNGSVDYEPDYRFVLDIDGSDIEHLLVSATGELSMEVDAEASSPALDDLLSGEILLAEIEYIYFIPIAPPFIGIYGDVGLAFYAGYGVTTTSPMTLTSGVHFSVTSEAGAEYINEEWGPIAELELNAGYDVPTWNEVDTVSFRAYVIPEIDIEILDILGPSIYSDPAMNTDLIFQYDPF